MNRRQLLATPLALMVPVAAAPEGAAPAKPVPSGKVLIFRDGTFASGRLSETERAAWREQLQMAHQDPDYTIITSHRVQCYDTGLRGRIVSVPGATDQDLRTVRDQVDRYLVQEDRA